MPQQPVRLVKKIVVTFSTPDGATDEITIEHSGGGEDIDAVVMSPELMNKLAYLENGQYREPEKRPGRGGWKVRGGGAGGSGAAGRTRGDASAESSPEEGERLMSLDASTAGGQQCVWLHDNGCSWLQYCVD